MQRGLLVGVLIALATASAPVYDDWRSHQNALEMGVTSSWFPDPLWTIGPAVIALVALALIVRAATKGKRLFPLAVVFGTYAALLTAWETYDVSQFPGDATTMRIIVMPAVLATMLVAALALARRHDVVPA